VTTEPYIDNDGRVQYTSRGVCCLPTPSGGWACRVS
jgi:hypothetical protein